MWQGKNKEKPGLVNSIIRNKCPRCRKGNIYQYSNAYDVKHMMSMHENCSVCGQAFELEVGFYYGTGYVSYGLSLMVCVVSFVAWVFTIGISLEDNRFFWWMAVNAILLMALQPLLMRLSRTIWLSLFVHFDPDWKFHSPIKVERNNDQLKNGW